MTAAALPAVQYSSPTGSPLQGFAFNHEAFTATLPRLLWLYLRSALLAVVPVALLAPRGHELPALAISVALTIMNSLVIWRPGEALLEGEPEFLGWYKVFYRLTRMVSAFQLTLLAFPFYRWTALFFLAAGVKFGWHSMDGGIRVLCKVLVVYTLVDALRQVLFAALAIRQLRAKDTAAAADTVGREQHS